MSTMTSSETSTDSAEASGEDTGEFALIARMAARLKGGLPEGVVGIGDDCAALPLSGGGVQLLTCDVMVDGRHFKSGATGMADVGWRVATASVSDICACGGLPGYALVSLVVPPHQTTDSLEALYEGLAEAEADYGFRVIGCNVSGGALLSLDMFMLGETPRFVSAGGARPGRRIACIFDVDRTLPRHRDLFPIFDLRTLGVPYTDTELCLSAETYAGETIEGCDEIDAMPRSRPNAHHRRHHRGRHQQHH